MGSRADTYVAATAHTQSAVTTTRATHVIAACTGRRDSTNAAAASSGAERESAG